MSRQTKINFAVLNAFKSVQSHLKIPTKFVVPNDANWPQEFHGLKLGSLAQSIRSKARNIGGSLETSDFDQLREIGFHFGKSVSIYISDETVLSAFKQFKLHHEHTEIPRNFVIPTNDSSWSEEVWGLKLGQILHKVSHYGSHKNIHKDLLDLGVHLGPKTNGRDFNKTYTALVAYKSIYGHVDVPTSFIVPKHDFRFPENTRGLKLGLSVLSLRANGAFQDHKSQLVALGVNYEIKRQTKVSFSVIYEAIKCYIMLHDSTHVPLRFVVPKGDTNYPENTWGLLLGSMVSDIRNRNNYPEHREKLEALGIRYKNVATVTFPIIYSALKSYKALHAGSLLVPYRFVVPKDDASGYPKETWGLKLGVIVRQIQNKDAWSMYREKFKELGLVYKNELDAQVVEVD